MEKITSTSFYDRDKCSDSFDNVTPEKFILGSFISDSSKNRMKYYSCMRQSDCGNRLWTPSDESWKVFSILPAQVHPSTGKNVNFRYDTICNYELSFDADMHCKGDEIVIQMDDLTNTKVIIGIGQE